MPKVFPTGLFAPSGVDFDIEARTISGGTALNDEEDVIATDGGGRWGGQFTDFYLDDPAVGRAYRALSALSDGGATPFFVPFCDHRYTRTGSARITVPHSDGAPFSDESEYSQSGGGAVTTASAALRATVLTIDDATDVDGADFSIDHPTMRHRTYRVAEVSGNTITIRPPLREAVPSGTTLNFADPMCTMRVDGPMRSPANLGFIDAPAVRFVEHFPGPEGYV